MNAAEALAVDRELVESAAASSSSGPEFDLVIDGNLEDWQMIALQDLEAGVATSALALNAAGCVSTTNCRGHPASRAVHPTVHPRHEIRCYRGRLNETRTGAEHAEHHSGRPDNVLNGGFLNRARRFESCRGHRKVLVRGYAG
jgi:hypothetical protein